MDRVAVLTASLRDRQSELDSARALVATRESELASAQAAFAKCNGDFETFRTAKDLVEFQSRQLGKAQSAVEMARSNYDACSTALASAERESQTAELMTTVQAPFAPELRDGITRAREHARAALGELGPIESAYVARLVACRQLQELGAPAPTADSTARFAPILVASLEQAPHSLLPDGWLQLLKQFSETEIHARIPGLGLLLAACIRPESFTEGDTRQQVVAGRHGGQVEPVPCAVIRLQQLAALSPAPKYREQLGQLESERTAARQRAQQAAKDQVQRDAVERLRSMPADEVTGKHPSEPFLKGTSERIFKSVRYGIEHWHDPLTGVDSAKLVSASSTVSLLAPKPTSVETFQSDGLELELCRFADGSRIVREPPKPGLIARALPVLNSLGHALLPKSLLDESHE